MQHGHIEHDFGRDISAGGNLHRSAVDHETAKTGLQTDYQFIDRDIASINSQLRGFLFWIRTADQCNNHIGGRISGDTRDSAPGLFSILAALDRQLQLILGGGWDPSFLFWPFMDEPVVNIFARDNEHSTQHQNSVLHFRKNYTKPFRKYAYIWIAI